MIANDAAAFEAGMIALAAVTGKELDTVIKRAYWVGLEQIPLPTLQGAFRLAMTCCDFFPSVAEIRRLCDEYEADQRGEFALSPPPVAALPAGEPEPITEVYEGDWGPTPEGATYCCVDCGDTGFIHYVCTPEDRNCSFDLCKKKRRRDDYSETHTWCRKCPCTKKDAVTGKCSNAVIQRRVDEARAKQGLPPQGTYAKQKPRVAGKKYRRYEED